MVYKRDIGVNKIYSLKSSQPNEQDRYIKVGGDKGMGGEGGREIY